VLIAVEPDAARTCANIVLDDVFEQMERKDGSVSGCLYMLRICARMRGVRSFTEECGTAQGGALGPPQIRVLHVCTWNGEYVLVSGLVNRTYHAAPKPSALKS
jgi:hypothetical protein